MNERRSGVCRVCGCTPGHACSDEYGSPCRWIDAAKTLCSGCYERQQPPVGIPSSRDGWALAVLEAQAFLERDPPSGAVQVLNEFDLWWHYDDILTRAEALGYA